MARSLRSRLFVFAGSFALVAAGHVPPPQGIRLEVPALLSAYAAGRFDEALNAVRRAGDSSAQALRLQWGAARPWIEADPSLRRRRYLVTAALVLETEILRAERNDWLAEPQDCGGRCVIDWASTLLLERGEPDEAERLWRLAVVALAGGVRDWTFLHLPVDARQPYGHGIGSLALAFKRFPDDPRFRLDRAMALASRFYVTTDGEARTSSPASPFATIRVFPEILERSGSQRHTVLAATIAELSALAADPAVGGEASVRLGYLHWAIGDDGRAKPPLEAATQAADKDVRYLAHYLLGHAALTRGQAAEAAAAFRAALEARPHSESASLVLASLELQRGEAGKAYALARDPFDQRRGDVDPWRQFLYGRYPQLPALVTAVRAEVTR